VSEKPRRAYILLENNDVYVQEHANSKRCFVDPAWVWARKCMGWVVGRIGQRISICIHVPAASSAASHSCLRRLDRIGSFLIDFFPREWVGHILNVQPPTESFEVIILKLWTKGRTHYTYFPVFL